MTHSNKAQKAGSCVKQPKNMGISCEHRHCLTCGWNPDVEMMRKMLIRKNREQSEGWKYDR